METILDIVPWLLTFGAFTAVALAVQKWLIFQQNAHDAPDVVAGVRAFLMDYHPQNGFIAPMHAYFVAHVEKSVALLGEPPSRVREICGQYLFTGVTAGLIGQAFATLAFGQILPFAFVFILPVAVSSQCLQLRLGGDVRIKQIGRDLPRFLNTLTLLVSAGSTLENGLQTASRAYAGTALGDEVRKLLRDRDVGMDRTSTFFALADRIPRADVRSLAGAIETSDRLGTPLAQTLEDQATAIMRDRLERASRLGKEAAVKLALPNTLILLAIALLIIGGVVQNLTGAM